tara:strand:- start:162 stop:482 length:321 start_codon:yes stop_codon:yes gene_type:complete
MAEKTLDDFTTQATTEVNSEKPIKITYNDTTRECNSDEYDVIIKNRAQAYYDEYRYDYIQSREQAYGRIGDQLDLLYKDIVAGKVDATGEFAKNIKAVKDANPKPS